MHNAELSRCLAACDVAGIRKLWAHFAPHLPQPQNDHEALISIHNARTQVGSFSLRLRAYSHRWLIDNGYPSALPDELKPRAERMFPRVVEGVGIAVGGASELGRGIAPLVRLAMSDAVLDVYADSITRSPDPLLVRKQMAEAKKKTIRQLLGR